MMGMMPQQHMEKGDIKALMEAARRYLQRRHKHRRVFAHAL